MTALCPRCRGPLRLEAQSCSRCGCKIKPSTTPNSHPSPSDAMPTFSKLPRKRPSLLLIAVKGAAWGLAVGIGFAFAEGLLSASSLAARSHQAAGYEAGCEARRFLLLVGVWPMILGAAVSMVGAKSGRKKLARK